MYVSVGGGGSYRVRATVQLKWKYKYLFDKFRDFSNECG